MIISVYWIGLESEPNNGYYEENIKDVAGALESLDYDGEGFIVRKRQMEAKDYLALPEFTGF